jgi:hypothetical protein
LDLNKIGEGPVSNNEFIEVNASKPLGGNIDRIALDYPKEPQSMLPNLKGKITSDIRFVRSLITGDKQKFYFNESGVKYIEIPQYYADLPVLVNKLRHNLKIGSLDFETYLDSNNDSVVYAGGIA